MSEIGDQEKIDIVVFNEDLATYIINALSPTAVKKVILHEASKKATVLVPEDQLSIAIGKGGQNVRLASKLTGYELDIESDKAEVEQPQIEKEATVVDLPKVPKLKKKEQLESSLLEAIEEHGQ
jgi:N utilization substance protein A